MTTKYFAILTNQGAARLANATMLGTKLNITQMAVGDGNGTLPTPDPAQTKLINQTRIAPINSLSVDANDAGQIIAEQIIPENEGGFFIREIGLYDEDGILIAVANCPETYKPLLAEGSGRTQTIRMILVVSSTSAITLKIDPSVVLSTRQYVDDKVIEVKAYADSLLRTHERSRNHPDATLDEKGFVRLSNSVSSESELIAATLKAVKIVMDNANARLAKERNGADIPNVALFLQNLGLLDTINKAAGAMQKSANGADISNVAAFRNALQLGSAALASMGTGKDQVLSASHFTFYASGNGYLYIPCLATTDNPVKIMLQWGTIQTRGGEDAIYNLPYAFPTGGLWAMGCRGTTGYSQAMNVRLANRSQISIQNWAPAGSLEDCCFFAVGYL
ncbi:phage tail protein [Citrobacter braakii]|uniref:phage tail protein n=1 Tax=Citrobacter braakii TaxID=57706 RepID=UPI00387E0661